jgi:hypothetical protein
MSLASEVGGYSGVWARLILQIPMKSSKALAHKLRYDCPANSSYDYASKLLRKKRRRRLYHNTEVN